jgi:hypothetical protein
MPRVVLLRATHLYLGWSFVRKVGKVALQDRLN